MINKNIFAKTKNSLIKINIIVVSIFLIIFSSLICFYFKKITYNSIDNKLKDELENITTQLSQNSLFYPIVLKYPSNMVYVYEENRIRYFTRNGYFEDVIPNKKDKKSNNFFTYNENGYTFRELSVHIGQYEIQIIRNIDSEIGSLKQLMFIFIVGVFISVLITYFIALYLTKKALVPIETAWSNQSKFIQDASHELRTPITIISSKLETLLKVPNNTVNEEVETIADAMKETRRVKKMINDLLSLTKEEAIVKQSFEKIELEGLLEEISKDYIDIAQIQEKDFRLISNLKIKNIVADKAKLRQLIVIFIDNAFKYTKRQDKITIEANQKNNNFISISIIDSGIGIRQDEISYIFDRFFRSENVRNKEIDGAGIGLSIAKMIALNLDIDIEVESELNKYTKFDIIIPVNKIKL